MTDQEKRELLKNALWDHHEAKQDLAAEEVRLAAMQKQLESAAGNIKHLLEIGGQPAVVHLPTFTVPTADQLQAAAEELRAAQRHVVETRQRCETLGLDT